jgi:acetyl-CoA C-acetyltransferase
LNPNRFAGAKKLISKVAVSGTALTPFNRRKDNSSFRDWACAAFHAALEQSSLEHADIEALFVSTESDFFTLQLNPASVLASDNGLQTAATTRIEGGGASGQLAIHAAVRAIQSGACRHVAVIGVDPSASQLPADAVRTLYGYSFDAWHDGMTGTTSTALYALSYQMFADNYKTDDEQLAQVTMANRANAMHNPNAHLGRLHSRCDIQDSALIASPYRRLHCSPLSDGASAVILSAVEALPANRKHAARVAGIGAASDHAHLGSRDDPGHFKAKTLAMQRACREAAITPARIELAEVYDA